MVNYKTPDVYTVEKSTLPPSVVDGRFGNTCLCWAIPRKQLTVMVTA